MIVALISTAIASQAVPMKPSLPWEDAAYVGSCSVVLENGSNARFALTLAGPLAMITDGDGIDIDMHSAALIQELPMIVRGRAKVRRFEFGASQKTISVRQLYQNNDLKSTFMVIGNDASDGIDMPFEMASGFCSSSSSSKNEAMK